MSSIKKLAGQTAIYGLSSIVGRLLNYLLVPFYTRIFSPAEYGVVSELLAYVSFIMIIFTYGMETSFFHFSEKDHDRNKVYASGVLSLLGSSFFLSGLMIVFSSSIANWIQYPKHPEYITWFALTLALDALSALPFARLRQQNKARRFAAIKIINILVNIGFNIFFLVLCPKWSHEHGFFKELSDLFYSPKTGVGYVFISYLLSSLVTLLLLVPQFKGIRFEFDPKLWKQMIIYGFPLLIGGFAGMINETFDRAVYKYLAPDRAMALKQLGIYSACYKLSIVMTLFIQTFRYAAEPFFFSHHKKENNKQVYAEVMKYFIITCSFIFLLVMLFMDVFKIFIGEDFRSGLAVVPVLLMANMCLGIYYNLSMWYKLTGQTRFGAYFSIFGAVLTIILLWWLIPLMGYMGAAWATLIVYAAMMIFSYVTGQKYYRIDYDVPRNLMYIGLALLTYFASYGIERLLKPGQVMEFAINAILLLLFAGFVFVIEKPKIPGSG
ncbi:MAG TPA: oligosaccharide flippase family protein [Bacteroidia bacterium]|nr:oligosaccharide flippase family protein [Bacteroidia bacterium]